MFCLVFLCRSLAQTLFWFYRRKRESIDLYLDQVRVHAFGASGAGGQNGGRQLWGRQASRTQRCLCTRQLVADLHSGTRCTITNFEITCQALSYVNLMITNTFQVMRTMNVTGRRCIWIRKSWDSGFKTSCALLATSAVRNS